MIDKWVELLEIELSENEVTEEQKEILSQLRQSLVQFCSTWQHSYHQTLADTCRLLPRLANTQWPNLSLYDS